MKLRESIIEAYFITLTQGGNIISLLLVLLTRVITGF